MSRIVVLLAVLALAGPKGWAQYGESLRGASLLRERGCTDCHAVLGRGGGRASDLTAHGAAGSSPASFAAELWNHAPEMWSAMAGEGRTPPQLSSQDIRDVFAFLYAVRYFEPSGDADRGRRVFAAKECHRCHGLVRVDAGAIAPAVPDWPALTDPVRLLEAMWNHGDLMEEETSAMRRPWPELTARELADLLTYVYNLPDLPPRLGRLALGSADAGMRLFDDLGCIRCHSILERDPDLIPLVQPSGSARTITDLAVAMWNHRPVMQEWAAETGMEIPELQPGQMGQLLSYLIEEAYLERPGNEKRGMRVYEAKGCAGCHDGAEASLPTRQWRSMDLVAAVWRHGPNMRERLAAEGMRWPALTEADVADVTAWLNVKQ